MHLAVVAAAPLSLALSSRTLSPDTSTAPIIGTRHLPRLGRSPGLSRFTIVFHLQQSASDAFKLVLRKRKLQTKGFDLGDQMSGDGRRSHVVVVVVVRTLGR